MSHSARFAFAAMARVQQQALQKKAVRATAGVGAASDLSDEESAPAAYSSPSSFSSSRNVSTKRKRRDDEDGADSEGASSSSSSSSSPTASVPSTLPCLSDVEPRAPAGFVPRAKFLLSFHDSCRDRGSAKLAIVHVKLGGQFNFTSSFKIDGRKSFSNAPYKRYYSRAIHACWFGVPTPSSSATLPQPNGTERSRTAGRVLLFLSQRNGRPAGKAFTGMRHEDSRAHSSSKHPLICLASNSAEYFLTVLVNQADSAGDEENEEEFEEGETEGIDWSAADVEVSARFDAGESKMESVALPGGAASAAASGKIASVVQAPTSKQARTQLPHVSSMRSLHRASSTESDESSVPSAAAASSFHQLSSAAAASASASSSFCTALSECDESDDAADFVDADATPLHDGALSSGDSSTECGGLDEQADFHQQHEPMFHLAYDALHQHPSHDAQKQQPELTDDSDIRSSEQMQSVSSSLRLQFNGAAADAGLSIPIAARYTSETTSNPFFLGEASQPHPSHPLLCSPKSVPTPAFLSLSPPLTSWPSSRQRLHDLPSIFVPPPPMMMHALSVGTSGAGWTMHGQQPLTQHAQQFSQPSPIAVAATDPSLPLLASPIASVAAGAILQFSPVAAAVAAPIAHAAF
jgi:hypothetical protein